MKKQLIFYKGGRLRFVGHLDMMRTMHRALTRAGIPLCYSQGFNPHPQMSFAAPLSLGCEGEREIMEIRMEQDMSDRDVMEALNRQLPEGLKILAVRTMEDNADSAMALVRANEYRITFPEDLPVRKTFDTLMQQDDLMLMKLGKVHGRKQMVPIDAKPLVYRADWINDHILMLLVAGGSETNLKPEILLEKLYADMKVPERQHEEFTTRTAMFGGSAENLIPLTDISDWETRL